MYLDLVFEAIVPYKLQVRNETEEKQVRCVYCVTRSVWRGTTCYVLVSCCILVLFRGSNFLLPQTVFSLESCSIRRLFMWILHICTSRKLSFFPFCEENDKNSSLPPHQAVSSFLSVLFITSLIFHLFFCGLSACARRFVLPSIAFVIFLVKSLYFLLATSFFFLFSQFTSSAFPLLLYFLMPQ